MNLEQILQRLAEIKGILETRGAEISPEDLGKLEIETADLQKRKKEFLESNEKRLKLLDDISTGATESRKLTAASFINSSGNKAEQRSDENIYNTTEYRNAFMEYVCRGTPIPIEYRANEVTNTTDASAVIPTTTLQELVKTLDTYGNIYAKVRKLNIQGGVRVPILTLKPTATWIGEGKSDSQKIKSDKYITFSYYGIECKIAQTLLVNVVTYDMFQQQFVPLAAEAIVKEIERTIIAGTGTGQCMGVTKDNRVPTNNTITLSSVDFNSWSGWKKQVFAKMKKSYRNGIFHMAQGTFDGYIDGMVDDMGQPIGRVNYGITDGEKYRFGGKLVETVENDLIASYDDAEDGDVVAVFFNPQDYAINSNMQMTVVKWTDHDTNEVKNKCTLICDGKLLDANGVIIIKKGA